MQHRRRRLSEDGIGRRGRGETNESEGRVSGVSARWIVNPGLHHREDEEKKEKERERRDDNYIWKLFKDVFQLAAVTFANYCHICIFFFFLTFSLPQSIMKHSNLFMRCSGSTCEIVWQIQPS